MVDIANFSRKFAGSSPDVALQKVLADLLLRLSSCCGFEPCQSRFGYPGERIIDFVIRSPIVDFAAVNEEFPKVKQSAPDPAPYPDIAADQTCNLGFVIQQVAISCVEQVKNPIVGAAFLKREICHPNQGGVRVAFVPAQNAHQVLDPRTSPHSSILRIAAVSPVASATVAPAACMACMVLICWAVGFPSSAFNSSA